jgi:hypothetical protein
MALPDDDAASTAAAPDSPLPAGWVKAKSGSMKRYYWHHAASGTSQWHPPTKEEGQDPLLAKKNAEEKAEEERRSGGPMAQKRDASPSSLSASVSIHQGGASAVSSNKRARTASGDSNNSSAAAAAAAPSSSRTVAGQEESSSSSFSLVEKSRVAIIVPFRDNHVEQKRSEHLSQFLPHMSTFLSNNTSIETFTIYIVQQSNDGRKFNRGKLLNIGFDLARKSDQRHDVFIFHDVDLLPHTSLSPYYSKFPNVPMHIARCWDRYSNNPKYFGGIVSFSASDMRRINGYPNTFWGWGGEDDEMQKRCERLNIKWQHPKQSDVSKDAIQDLENMDLTTKLEFLRGKKNWKCNNKWEALEEHDKTWRTNGLADLSYKVESKEENLQGVKNACLVSVDVQLNPDNHWTNSASKE